MRIVGPFETLSRTSDDRIQPTIPIALVPLGRMLFGDALQSVTSPYFRPGPFAVIVGLLIHCFGATLVLEYYLTYNLIVLEFHAQ